MSSYILAGKTNNITTDISLFFSIPCAFTAKHDNISMEYSFTQFR